jgi:D-glycero-D-manno-heptose 1,7-bisphosphate phosphatase
MGIDLSISWMIGDILNDVEAGNRAGCKSVLIDNGNETEWLSGEWRIPWANVANINEAAEYILKADEE